MIALAQMFTNVGDIEDHAFNQWTTVRISGWAKRRMKRRNTRDRYWCVGVVCRSVR